jgi:hypothetical protein
MSYIDGLLEQLSHQDRHTLGKFLKDNDSRPLPGLDTTMPDLRESFPPSLQQSR